jgi:hypothetical protein
MPRNPYGEALINRIRDLEQDTARRAGIAAEASFALQDALTEQDRGLLSLTPSHPSFGAFALARAHLCTAASAHDPEDPALARLPRCRACQGTGHEPGYAHHDAPQSCEECKGSGIDTRPPLLILATELRDRIAENFPTGHPGNDPGPVGVDLWHTLNFYIDANTPTPASALCVAAVAKHYPDIEVDVLF